MTSTVAGLLAEPLRLRVFSAVVLGAESASAAGAAAGTGPRETVDALRRLRGGGLVEEVDGELRACGEPFKDAARATAAAERLAEEPARSSPDAVLRTYVRDGRLLALPSKFSRRQMVLRHVARHGFTPGETYAEPAVNDILRQWCADSETDHVALRRYLVEAGLLDRHDGRYWLCTDSSEGASATAGAPDVSVAGAS